MPSISNSLGVLRERPYRFLFSGQAVSLLGDGMVNVSLAFAVISLDGSALDIGIVFAARSIALVTFLLAGGVIADRCSRRLLLINTDIARVISQGLIATFLITGNSSIWMLAGLSAVTGMATGIFNPTSTGFLPMVVSGERIQQANALRGFASSVGRVAGPATAGLLVATVGAGWALATDAVTFAVSAVLISRIRIGGHDTTERSSFFAELRDGWDAFRSRRWLWSFVTWMSFCNLLYGCWTVVGPLMAERHLGGATAWGFIIAISGVGGILGGLVALRVNPRRPLLVSILAMSIFFVPFALLAIPAPLGVIAAGAAVAEIGLIIAMSVWESTMQRHIDASTLSRVSSYSWFGSTAFQPVGLAIWGPIALAIGYSSSLWLVFALQLVSLCVLITVREVRVLPRSPEPSEQLATG